MDEPRPQRDAPHEWRASRRKIRKTRAEASQPISVKNRRIGLQSGAAPEVRIDDLPQAPLPWRCQRCRKHHKGECP